MVAAHTSSHPSSSAGWIICLDKRPTERSREDVDAVLARLRTLKAFERFHPSVLQQMCLRGFYEYLERGVTLYRQGDIGTSWYAVLSGSLDVKVSETANHQDAVTICTLGAGTAFGESVLDDRPRPATIVTRETSELLRLGQTDFRCLWGVSDRLFLYEGSAESAVCLTVLVFLLDSCPSLMCRLQVRASAAKRLASISSLLSVSCVNSFGRIVYNSHRDIDFVVYATMGKASTNDTLRTGSVRQPISASGSAVVILGS
ncbi:unnamed protein product [Arctogadus glacialis]